MIARLALTNVALAGMPFVGFRRELVLWSRLDRCIIGALESLPIAFRFRWHRHWNHAPSGVHAPDRRAIDQRAMTIVVQALSTFGRSRDAAIRIASGRGAPRVTGQ